MKKLLLYCLVAMIVAIVSNRIFARYGMHEQALFLRAAEASDQWEQQLRKEHDHIYVLASGSSGRFGINPQIMLDEHDIPLVVASGVAGFGFCPNVALGWKHLKKGDTLLLAFEGGLLTSEKSTTCPNAGLNQAASRLGIHMFDDDIIPFNYDHLRRSIQLESTSVYFNLFKSVFFQNRLYRYLYGTVLHDTGWLEISSLKTDRTWWCFITPPANLNENNISDTTKEYLKSLLNKAEKKGIRIIASSSPLFANPQKNYAALWQALELTRLGIPVAYLPDAGYYINNEWLGDIQGHLRGAGANHFSSLLAKSLKEQRFWTEAELIEELRVRGWNEDGSPIPNFQK